MSTNIKHTNYVDQPCERCGSKRTITRTWKEKIPSYSGTFITVDCSQLTCSNKACESEFIKKQADEAEKKETNRVKKEEHDAARKESALAAAHASRKNSV